MVNLLSRPVNSFVNARIKEEQAKAEKISTADADENPEKDLKQDDAPEGGEKQEGAETPTEEKPAEPAPEPESPPSGERFVPGAMTPEEIKATAREAVREEIEAREPEPAEPPAVPRGTPEDEGLSEAAQDQLVVLREMAALNPAHKDLPERQKKFWKQEEKYRAQWEQANPGAAFDPNSGDHASFYKNEPFVPMRDFKAAERSIIAREAEERAVNRLRKEQEPRLREIELKEREREAAPEIANSVADTAEEVFASVPQFKDLFKPKALSKADMEKAEQINPILADDAQAEMERAVVLVGELEKLTRLPGHYQIDYSKKHKAKNGQVIAPHVELEHEAGEAEVELLKKSERNGKKLISVAERDARVQQINRMPAARMKQAAEELFARYDWLQPSDTRAHIIAKSKARLSQKAERFAKITPTAAQNSAPDNKPAPSTPKPAATPAKPSGKAGLPRGTSGVSSSDVADNAPKTKSEVEKTADFLVNRYRP